MFEFPCRLSVIKSWGISRKLELLHKGLRPTLFAFEQKRHVNLEFDQLCCLILVATGSLFKQCFKTLPRFSVVFFLKWNLREIVLRLAEFRIEFRGNMGVLR